MLSRLGTLDLVLLGVAAFIAISFLVRIMKAYQDKLIQGIRQDLEEARARKRAAYELEKHQERRRKAKEAEEQERIRRESRMSLRGRRAAAVEKDAQEQSLDAQQAGNERAA